MVTIMSRDTWVILYLSTSLALAQLFWLKAEKRAAYLQGQADVYRQQTEMGPDADPYTKVTR